MQKLFISIRYLNYSVRKRGRLKLKNAVLQFEVNCFIDDEKLELFRLIFLAIHILGNKDPQLTFS